MPIGTHVSTPVALKNKLIQGKVPKRDGLSLFCVLVHRLIVLTPQLKGMPILSMILENYTINFFHKFGYFKKKTDTCFLLVVFGDKTRDDRSEAHEGHSDISPGPW